MTMLATKPVNEDTSRFADQGYCVVRQCIPSALVAHHNDILGGMISELKEGQRPERLTEPHIKGASWREWLNLCRNPNVLNAVAASLQCEELVLLMSHLIVKAPYDGFAIAWHQDNTYWSAVTGTDVVTVWFALDDTDEENSCMKVIPCTHDGYEEMEMLPSEGRQLLEVRVDVTAEMEASAVPIELQAGDVSIHDSFVIHGSDANTSPRRRAGYTMRYGNAATVSVDQEKHYGPIYYVRGDGSHLIDGYRDVREDGEWPDNWGRME